MTHEMTQNIRLIIIIIYNSNNNPQMLAKSLMIDIVSKAQVIYVQPKFKLKGNDVFLQHWF